MKHLLASLTLILLAPFTGAQSFDHEHSALTKLLASHVHGDRVDYRALGKDRPKLDAYLTSLEGVRATEFKKWESDQRFAFWINAYNAYTLELILDEYPLKSIKKIGGFFSAGPWERRFVPLQHLAPDPGKKKLNLETIEHKILRPVFSDPRVHAAINCASVGCPPLRKEAYVASRLGKQLAEQTSIWLGDAARNSYNRAKNSVEISKIFDWFDEDFGKKDAAVLRWIAAQGPADKVGWLKTATKVKLRYTSYDWDLNDIKR